MHPNFFGYAAAERQALHSRKSGHRMFSRQHLTASRALVPAIRESSNADPGSTQAEPTRSRLQPSETELPRNAKKAQTKEIGMHPLEFSFILLEFPRPSSNRQLVAFLALTT